MDMWLRPHIHGSLVANSQGAAPCAAHPFTAPRRALPGLALEGRPLTIGFSYDVRAPERKSFPLVVNTGRVNCTVASQIVWGPKEIGPPCGSMRGNVKRK